MVSATEIVLGRQCPRAEVVRCGLQGTLSGETEFQLKSTNSMCSTELERTLERKSMPMVAWYMLSKESYINRVIKEVLPTIHHSSEQSDEAYESIISNHTALFAKKDKPVVIMSASVYLEV